MPMPEFWAFVTPWIEFVLTFALILGIATRYVAIGSFLFVLAATLIAHRYWEYPAAQQIGQFNNFTKNIAIMGGSLLAFITGGGRYSLDSWFAKRN
jgi:putative oxidoreductase